MNTAKGRHIQTLFYATLALFLVCRALGIEAGPLGGLVFAAGVVAIFGFLVYLYHLVREEVQTYGRERSRPWHADNLTR